MAGALKKTMIYLGLADDEEHYAEERRGAEPRGQAHDERPVREVRSAGRAEQISHSAADWDRDEEASRAPARAAEPEHEYRAPVTPIKRAAHGREDASAVRQITTVHPRSYNDAKLIGESFRSGVPVIMNLTDMGENEAKRLVDFSAGLVFGLHGSIERVTNKVFLLTPVNVQVLGEDPAADEDQAHFFNQS